MSRPDPRLRRYRRRKCSSWVSAIAAVATLVIAAASHAARVNIEINGLESEQREAALASLELQQYVDRDVSAVQIRRLFDGADDEIRKAMEPFGYYQARVERRLEQQPDGNFKAVFDVTRGEPVIVQSAQVEVTGGAAENPNIRAAIRQFRPKVGDQLDHAQYETSKAVVETALRALGFLDARPLRHRVEVTRSANAAAIDVAWEGGERYRFGAVRFSKAQFPEKFLQRYVPWKEGAAYTEEQLAFMQQRMVDADYFASVAVQPAIDERKDGLVPVDVFLVPNKRTVYSASAYVSTDSGPGVRLGFERRWLNDRGHKLDADLDYSQRLQSFTTAYHIPRPGPDHRSYNLGVGYRNEETDTSTSETLRIAANDSRIWRGYTRTIGLQFLSGDFEIADEPGSSNILFLDAMLSRKSVDNTFFPRRGVSVLYGLRAAQEGMLADTSFLQARADAKWVRPVKKDGRLIVRATVGAMTVDDFDVLPPELRFFAGGDRSVRGFDYQAIGEKNSSGGVIGGRYLNVVSAEYEHYFLPSWGAAAFVDAGDAFNSDYNANIGAGVGVRWKSPVGLVRLDVGFPVVTDLDDDGVRIHVMIGPDL
jgi:translocation and assembly module TamA